MIEYMYSLLYTIIHIVLWNIFVSVFSQKKNVNKYIFYWWLIVLAILNYGTAYYLQNQFAMKQIVAITVNAVIVSFIYMLSIKRAFALAVLFQGCSLTVEYLSYVILLNAFGQRVEELINSNIFCFLMGLLCQMLMFCVISIIRKSLSKKLGYLLSEMEWLRFSMFPIFCIIAIILLMFNFEFVQDGKQGIVLVWIMSGLVVMNILIFGLLSDALKRESELADYKMIQERGRNDTEMYQAMIKNYNEQRKIVHEFKNHMEYMASLVQHGEYERLRGYVFQMQNNINHKHDLIDTNNNLVNIILNSKYLEACEKNILLSIKANDLSEIKIDDQDLVVILSNLLNNAIEASDECDKKIIKLKIVKEHKWMIISVLNFYKHELVKIEGKYVTSKLENVQYHGVGIENIKDAVDKYNGIYDIRSENNEFHFSILIPM